jgi:hypothetical protein
MEAKWLILWLDEFNRNLDVSIMMT